MCSPYQFEEFAKRVFPHYNVSETNMILYQPLNAKIIVTDEEDQERNRLLRKDN